MPSNLSHGTKNQHGISLMEILIAIGIFLFITTIVWLFVKQSYRVQNFSLDQATAITEAQRGVETMVKEIREALPGDTGAFAIDSADEFELIFYADYDRDQQIEKVRYYLNGSDFIKTVTEASGNPLQYLPESEAATIISRYVRNQADEPMFVYYDGSYSQLAAPANPLEIKLVHIHLKINVFQERAPADFHLESDAQVRNLKDNW